MLNNRETAILIWCTFIILAFLIKKTKTKLFTNTLCELFQLIFYSKLTIIFLAIIIYNIFTSWLISKTGLWNSSHIKTLIIWLLSYAFLILRSISSDLNNKNWFAEIWPTLKLSAIVIFIIELYTFSLLIEFLIFPIITIAIIFNFEISTTKNKYAQIIKLIANKIINSYFIVLLIYAVYMLIYDIQELYQMHSLKKSLFNNTFAYILPIYYSICYIPLLYTFALVNEYQLAINTIKTNAIDDIKIKQLKKLLLIFCNIKLNRIKLFRKFIRSYNLYDNNDIDCNDIINQITYIETMNMYKKDNNTNEWYFIEAKHFLKSENVFVGYYHPISDKEWWADSKNSDKEIFFRLYGNNKVVSLIKLSCNICTVINEDSQKKYFTKCANILINKATHSLINKKFNTSLINERNYLYMTNDFAIKLTFNKFEKCTDYTLEISPKHCHIKSTP